MNESKKPYASVGGTELSLWDITKILLAKIHWLLLAGVVVAAGVYAVVTIFVTPTYESRVSFYVNQRIIAGNAQFTGIAAGRGVGFTTGLLLLREGLGMRETPIRPHSWH